MGLDKKQTGSALAKRCLKFLTDPVGLERTIRLLQAVLQIGSHYSSALTLIHSIIDSTAAAPRPADATLAAIQSLHATCALSRRLFRLYRLIESLGAFPTVRPAPAARAPEPRAKRAAVAGPPLSTLSLTLSLSFSSRIESWLDCASDAFNTAYLLLEAATTVDILLARDSSQPFFLTAELERTLSLESSRFWLFSLICGALSGLCRVLGLLLRSRVQPRKHAGARPPKGGIHQGRKETGIASHGSAEPKAAPSRPSSIRPELQVAGRRCLANALDIAQPGAAVGWVMADRGLIGIVMLITTVLTAMDVWERCGEDEDKDNHDDVQHRHRHQQEK